MLQYRVNKNTDEKGYNEVHSEKCIYYNRLTYFEYLGTYSNGINAVNEAKRRGYNGDGCALCNPEAHKG